MAPQAQRLLVALALLLTLAASMGAPTIAAQGGGTGEGVISFEDGVDGRAIGTTISGARFSTSSGAAWLYGDTRTGKYNAPYPNSCPAVGGQCAYVVNGTHFAWAGEAPGTARVDFTQGAASFFKALFSTGETLTVEALSATGDRLASQTVSPNLRTGRLSAVNLRAEGIAAVVVHGAENRWLMDDLQSDALGALAPSDPEARSRTAAHVTVVQRLTGPAAVTPGSALTLTVVAANRGDGGAKNAVISVPLDPARVSVAGASFSRPGGWVSRLVTDTLELQTGPLGPGAAITATLSLLVLPTAPAGGAIGGALSFSWSDGAGGGAGRSNALLAGVGEALPTPGLAAEPAPVSGTARTFSATVFAPGEPVSLWYNTPDGRAVAVGTVAADAEGQLSTTFDPAGLPAGAYTMVAHGHWTELTVTAPFSVPA